jgi:drug/metabolite transporter (DMT)-like permease
MVLLATTAAVVAVMFWIVSGTLSKRIVMGLGIYIVPFIVVTLGLIPMLLATLLVGQYQIGLYSAFIAIIGGVFLSLGFIFAYMALRKERLATTSAFVEIQPAALVLLGIFVLGEHVTGIEIAGILIVFLGSMLVITTEKFRINKNLLPALYANICWAIYWIIMTFSVTSAGTFALPIFISRIAGMVVVLAYLMTNRKAMASLRNLGTSMRGSRAVTVLVALTVIGAFVDSAGDTVFGITVGSTVLAVGGALMAVAPMVVSFFGFLFYRERLRRIEIAGLLVMVFGAFVLTVL